MIVRDEATNIGPCLESVKELVDETIVLDTGSSDDTKEAARASGARVFDLAWCDDFARARNESIRHAQGDWIFWLDADDRVPRESRDQLAVLFSSIRNETVGYLMRVVCPAPDAGPLSDHYHVRLFPNDPRIRWDYRVHEQIGQAVVQAGGELRPTEIRIVHTGYLDPSFGPRKLARNLRLLDLDVESRPLDGYVHFMRAQTLLDLRRPAEALVALNFSEAFTVEASYSSTIPALAARAHALEGRLSEALESVRMGLLRSPRDPQLQFMEAEILAALGMYEQARQAIMNARIVGVEFDLLAAANRTLNAFRGEQLLAEIALASAEYTEAETLAREVIARRPMFGPAWFTLGESLLRQGALETFDSCFAELAEKRGTSLARLAMRVMRATLQGEFAEADRLLGSIEPPATTSLFVRREHVRLLFSRGELGPTLDRAIADALEANPLCIQSRASARILAQKRGGAYRPIEVDPLAVGPRIEF